MQHYHEERSHQRLSNKLIAPATSTGTARLWVSNSSSRGDRELHEATAVRHPAHLVEIGRCDWGAIDHRQWRIAIEGCVAPCRVVVDLELGQLSFQVTGIPERDLVEKFPPNRPDESLDKWV